MADVDDAIRPKNGVVVCLRTTDKGNSKLIFDDVKGDSSLNPIEWSFSSFYTWREYSDEDLDQMKLSSREYQVIGENLVTRLLALNGRIK
ncbi:MAG: hypothetical protein M3Y84_09690 [Acidobacteriota bacterium]|nr:hypothetical protein [Acidobacteriota bacterium]